MSTEHSAGGVVYRQNQQPVAGSRLPAMLWLICKHSGYHKWVLPKGIVESQEKPEEAAVREVKEETGVTARIIKNMTPDIRYHYTKNGMLVDKRVTFFLMEYVEGDVQDHNWEMEDARWVSEDDALTMLAFPDERCIFGNALISSHT